MNAATWPPAPSSSSAGSCSRRSCPGLVQHWKARLQGRRGPSPLQPYRELRRLWGKSAVDVEGTTAVYRLAPPVVAAALVTAVLLVPASRLAPNWGLGHDLLALAGMLALARFAVAAASWDVASMSWPSPQFGASRLAGTSRTALTRVAATTGGARRYTAVVPSTSTALLRHSRRSSRYGWSGLGPRRPCRRAFQCWTRPGRSGARTSPPTICAAPEGQVRVHPRTPSRTTASSTTTSAIDRRRRCRCCRSATFVRAGLRRVRSPRSAGRRARRSGAGTRPCRTRPEPPRLLPRRWSRSGRSSGSSTSLRGLAIPRSSS